jgi:hypothetical protein
MGPGETMCAFSGIQTEARKLKDEKKEGGKEGFVCMCVRRGQIRALHYSNTGSDTRT